MMLYFDVLIELDEVNANNSVKWKRFTVPKKVETIKTTYSKTQVKYKLARMKWVNDSEMSMRWNNEIWSILEISVLR